MPGPDPGICRLVGVRIRSIRRSVASFIAERAVFAGEITGIYPLIWCIHRQFGPIHTGAKKG